MTYCDQVVEELGVDDLSQPSLVKGSQTQMTYCNQVVEELGVDDLP